MDIEDLASSLVSAAQPHTPAPGSLAEVVARGCCMGCGICEGIAGSDFVRMELQGPRHRMRPAFLQPLSPELERRVLAACPGASVGASAPEAGVLDHPTVGPVMSVRKGHSTDPEVRFKAAAGGGLTALASYLVESGCVRFVLHVKASTWHRTEEHLGPKLSFTGAEVFEGRGSRYGPVAPLRTIGAVLDRNERFAFVGKPCDVNAMRNLALLDGRVDQLCAYMLTISCGGYSDNDCALRMLSKHGIAEAEVAEWRWRGHGCPGPCPYVRALDGREASMDYVDFWYANGGPAGPLTYQWRCKTCPDFMGYQADVTVMDCWPRGTPERTGEVTAARAHEQDGWVLLVARTTRGQALVDEVEAAGLLQLSPAAAQDVVDTQPHQVRRAVGLLSRRLGHLEEGAPQPVLGASAARRMVRAAFETECLEAAVGPGAAESAAPLLHDAAAEVAALVAGAVGDGRERLQAAFAALPARHLHFHAKNLQGCARRLLRGDAREEVVAHGDTAAAEAAAPGGSGG